MAFDSQPADEQLPLAGLRLLRRAVVAWIPAAHVWEGLSQKFFAPDYRPVSSWSLDGRPLPFMPFKASPEDKVKEMKGELSSFVAFHTDSLAQADPATIEKATIPVEKIRAPILLVSGTDDQTWPAGEFCAAIMARLKKAGFSYEVKHIVNEKGGHQDSPFSTVEVRVSQISSTKKGL